MHLYYERIGVCQLEIKYGKSSSALMDIKKDFFVNNSSLLQERLRIAELYNQQPKRKLCKLCLEPIKQEVDFTSHGIDYYICSTCGHLNGAHEETTNFTEQLYITDDYGSSYNEQELSKYNTRVKNIYLPKMEFLLESLNKDGLSKNQCNILDIGAGSGYFVAASHIVNINCQGIEISKTQVDYGNQMLQRQNLLHISESETADYIRGTKANVVTAIGVLEHILNFHEVLEAVERNPNIQYLYFSVPLFSLSCIIEAANSQLFNRQLGGAHTHLFSFDSLQYMNNKYHFTEVSRWQFGTDIMDLLRSIIIQLEEDNKKLCDIFQQKFSKLVDPLQLTIDKNNFCSEVHMLVKKTDH